MTATETGAPSDEVDPFEQFNRAMGMGLVADPYPGFAPLRAQHIAPLDMRPPTDGSTPDADRTEPDSGMPKLVSAASYDAGFEVLRDGKRCSSAAYGEVMGAVMGRTILEMD